MAPTVCIVEFPMAGTTVNTLVRRRRGPESRTKRRRFALEEMLRNGTSVETLSSPREHCSRRLDHADTVPSSVMVAERSGKYPTHMNENYRRLVAERRKDLLSIVIRTIILVRRNRILQRRLNELRAETRRFLSSMLNNPESQQQRSQVSSNSEDSPFMERTISKLLPLLDTNSTKNSFYEVTSSCDNCDYANDESSDSDKSKDSNKSEC